MNIILCTTYVLTIANKQTEEKISVPSALINMSPFGILFMDFVSFGSAVITNNHAMPAACCWSTR